MIEKTHICAILKRRREQMRRARLDQEMQTIYKDNVCPICRRRHMVGVICRKRRGNVCMEHCLECEHHERNFWNCLYRETEPVDMRKWRVIFVRPADWLPPVDKNLRTVLTALEAVVRDSISKSCVICDQPAENGDYRIVNRYSGEVMPYVLNFLEELDAWACVEYLPAEK